MINIKIKIKKIIILNLNMFHKKDKYIKQILIKLIIMIIVKKIILIKIKIIIIIEKMVIIIIEMK